MKVTHPTANFSIEFPNDWTRGENSDYFQFISPCKSVSVTISAYNSEDGPFDEFSEYRWSAVEDFYEQAFEQWELDEPKMIIREYKGVWPGENKLTTYIVACAHVGKTYLSIGIVTDLSYRSKHKKIINDILRSVK